MVDLSNPEAEAQQVLAWLEGKDDNICRTLGSYPDAGSEWYLLTTKWLNQWKVYVGVLPATSADVRHPGTIDNSDLLLTDDYVKDPEGNPVTLATLRCEIDYVICPPVCWNYLTEKYGVKEGSVIKRKSIQISDFETKVEVMLKPVVFGIVPKKGSLLTKLIGPLTLYTSRKSTKRELTAKFLSYINSSLNGRYGEAHIRLWKLSISYNYQEFEEFMLKPENCGDNDFNPNTLFPGHLLANQTLEDCELADEDIVICELRDEHNTFRFKTWKCFSCNELLTTMISCDCKEKKFCNEECLEDGKRYHTCLTGSSLSSNTKTKYTYSDPYDRYYGRTAEKKTYQETSTSRKGLAGLQNLGNTCFMNSGLQCLSNTWPLTEYFLANRHVGELNISNPLGTGGELANKFATLINELWLESATSFSPWEFKRVLSGFAPQFSGYSQHDSQELLSFTLDGLHEDLNRVKDKPYGQEIGDTEGKTDEEIARDYWTNFEARNQSVIVDNMYGQYRSEVTCPTCQTVSKAFDPFLMLTVSIPNKQYEIIDVVFVSNTQTKMSFMFPNKATALMVKEKVGEIVNVDPNALVVGKYSNFSLKSIYQDNSLVGGLYKHEGLAVYVRPEAHPLIVDFVKDISYSSTYSRKVPVCLSRVVPVNPEMSLASIYLELYKYILICQQDVLPTPDELVQSFEKAFPKLNGGFGTDFFAVNIVNSHNSTGGGYANTYYSSSYSSNYSINSYNKTCDFCKRRTCDNCPLPFTSDRTLADLIEAKTFETDLKLEIVLNSMSLASVDCLTATEEHASVDEVTQSEHEHKNRALSLEDCLEYSSQPEQLDASNTCYCKVCKEHVQAFKKMEVYKLPKVLVIHLKRFKIQGYYGSKINKTITFPIEGLDLTRFVKAPGQGTQIYDLTAVSNHFGSMGGGHYTAFAKNHHSKQWYNFDDSSCSSLRSDVTSSVVTGAAYVLFYERRELP